MSGSLATILPVHVFAAACDPACVEPDDVHPAERDAVGPRAVDRRRREFAAGRRCTRLALSQLHPALGDVGIPIGPDRAPLWPPGVVGSITHCAGYCAAVVARRDRFAGLGLDAEPNAALPDGVEALVCTSAERAWLRTSPPDDGVHWPTLVFSAKEALYKAWAPLTGRWLGFEDAELDIDTRASSFEARILVDAPPVTAAGRFVVADGRILCLAWLDGA